MDCNEYMMNLCAKRVTINNNKIDIDNRRLPLISQTWNHKCYDEI